jgi:hypothetical protein
MSELFSAVLKFLLSVNISRSYDTIIPLKLQHEISVKV